MKKSRLKRKTPLKRGKSRLKRTPLRRRSKKRAKQERKYSSKRADWIKGKRCAVCSNKATEVHHTNGREGNRLLDEEYWLAVCRICHRAIHEHPEWARENGYLC